jgi:rod shape-determining protein MreC
MGAILFGSLLHGGLNEFFRLRLDDRAGYDPARIQALRDDYVHLSMMLNNVTHIVEENRKLKQMLDLREKLWPSLVASQVIARSPFEWEHALLIDKGSSDGIKAGQLVIDERGNLVGKVERASPRNAWILLVTDADFTTVINCREERFLMQGSLSQYAKLLYVPYDAQCGQDEEVFVSRVALPTPRIPVGMIERIIKNEDRLTQTVRVRVYTDVESLSVVYVVAENEVER